MFDKKALKNFHEEKTNTRKTLLLKKTPTSSTSQVSKEERGKYCCGLPFNVNIASSQWKYQCLNKKTIAAIQSWSWTALITIRGGALKSLVAMKRRISSRDQLFYFVSTKTTLEWRYFRSSSALNINQNVLLYWNCDQTFIVNKGSLHLILFNISALDVSSTSNMRKIHYSICEQERDNLFLWRKHRWTLQVGGRASEEVLRDNKVPN